MALHLRSIRQMAHQNTIKGLMLQQFMSRQRCLNTYQPVHLPKNIKKPAFIQWNSTLELRRPTNVYPTANFHHLAEHLIYNIENLTNFGDLNFVKSSEKSSSSIDSRINMINNYYTNAKFREEKTTLLQKGVMKTVATEVPTCTQTDRR